jgi:hypothetical protein
MTEPDSLRARFPEDDFARALYGTEEARGKRKPSIVKVL